MTLKGHAKFKGRLTRPLKNVIRNLLIFKRAVEKLKIYNLMGSFCPKHIKIWMKEYRSLKSHGMSYDAEE